MRYTIEVIGLGAGDLDQLTLGIYKKLTKSHMPLYVRTAEHPAVKQMEAEGITFSSFDQTYTSMDQFQDVYEHISDILLTKAEESAIVYAVPGHPMLGEKTVQLLLEQNDAPVEIVGGHSYLDALFSSLKIDPIDGLQFVDGTAFERSQLDYRHHIVIGQVYDWSVASGVKLELLEDLPSDYPVTMIAAAGTGQETKRTMPLAELDHDFSGVHNLLSIYVAPVPDAVRRHTFTQLREVVATLRGPDGCPWDRAQTHDSLRAYAVEEVYELLEAIDEQNDAGMVEELGDLLLQVMLHSQIGEDNGYFTVDDVIYSITAKMIYRHPHVFGDQSAAAVNDVYETWDALKQKEKGSERQSVLDGVPTGLPGLSKAFKLQKKAAKAGYGKKDIHDIWRGLQDALADVQEVINTQEHPDIDYKLGDVLFAIADISRYYRINPEIALNETNNQFTSTFSSIEEQLQTEGRDIGEISPAEMNRYWKQAKGKE